MRSWTRYTFEKNTEIDLIDLLKCKEFILTLFYMPQARSCSNTPTDRGIAQWLIVADVAACRVVSNRLVQDFQRNIMFLPSQYWDIVSMLCFWARHFTLTALDLGENV